MEVGRVLFYIYYKIIKKSMSSNNIWSETDIETLKENYKILGPEKCSILLNRSKRACSEKAKKLNLSFNKVKWLEEELLKVVKNSKSRVECFDKLNIPTNSGNYLTLNKYIKIYNIDISHFENNTEGLKKYAEKLSIPLDNILVENSLYTSRNSLKKKLYKEGLKNRECELCGQNEYWMGKKMSLIIDHINGVPNDNRLENLRIVCPNCNATLETHCRGSKKTKKIENKNICICGDSKWKTSKLCLNCSKNSQRKVERPSLETLLKEIEELGYVGTGKKYGVSDNSIRKWVKTYLLNKIK